MLNILDKVMHLIHIVFTIFSALGWVYQPWLTAHLIVQGLVLLSWFGLGYFFGQGFCLLTDIHWKIREKLGKTYHSDSYMVWLLERTIRARFDESRVGIATMAVFFLCTLLNGMHFFYQL